MCTYNEIEKAINNVCLHNLNTMLCKLVRKTVQISHQVTNLHKSDTNLYDD